MADTKEGEPIAVGMGRMPAMLATKDVAEEQEHPSPTQAEVDATVLSGGSVGDPNAEPKTKHAEAKPAPAGYQTRQIRPAPAPAPKADE